ncbi:MAG: guanylate kinase [Chloroflexi bacterium]|nr:guanylate kinase [Chloroflexota bacterium]|tara:strand:- start:15320 stop:15877 length:558 start_codon:yes stop_codon:yes gene_type:complete
MQKIIVLSGPSGVGKDAIIDNIMEKHGDFVVPITMTSRPKRENEQNGNDYYFVSNKEFELSIKQEDLVEYSTVYEHYYGLPKSSMIDALSTGKNILVRLDVKGAISIMKQYSNSVSIFVSPENMEQLYQRINSRNQEDQKEINRRMNIAIQEIAQANLFDHVVLNEDDQLDASTEIIMDLIKYNK